MPDVIETIYGAYSIVTNGTYRLSFSDEGGKRHFSAAWNAKDVPAGGTLAFSFDGDQGQVPGVIEMTGTSRVITASAALPFVDIKVTGMPANGRITLFAR